MVSERQNGKEHGEIFGGAGRQDHGTDAQGSGKL